MFKIGDRVMYVDNNSLLSGKAGRVVGEQTYNGYRYVAVEFDQPVVGGHRCGGLAADYRGQWVNEESIVLEEDCEPVLIYKQGSSVYARPMKSKSNRCTEAQAKCHPDDTFSFVTGAKIAVERMLAKHFSVGDRVKCINPKQAYDTYHTWSGLTVGDVNYKQNFVYASIPDTDTEYIILNIQEHDTYDAGNLVLIQNPMTTQCFIVCEDALELI